MQTEPASEQPSSSIPISLPEPRPLPRRLYAVALGATVVTGLFVLTVTVLLFANYFQSVTSDPLNSVELSQLKSQLIQQPQDVQVVERIRSLDLRLRREYFRHREFGDYGAYLLIAGMALFLAGIKFVLAYHTPLPTPPSEPEGAEAREQRNRTSQWWVAGVGVSIVTLALVLGVTGDSLLSRTAVDQAGSMLAYPTSEEIAANWPQFRGPGGLGIAQPINVPETWDGATNEGILWKTPLSLPGNNSPVVWGERLFLTGATEEERAVYCFDTNTGEMLWEQPVKGIPGSPAEPPEVMEDTGFAAPTAVTNGRYVVAIFANGDLVCYDFAGNQIWAKNFGLPDNIYGHASSLAMFQDLVIVLMDQADAEAGLSSLMGVDFATGTVVWEAERPVPNSWASPVLIDLGTHQEIITCANPWVIANDPATGTELWRAECLDGDVAPSAVFGDGLVFVAMDYSVVAAIRPGGSGDVTETHVVWTAEDGLPDICSPVTNGEILLLVQSYGILTCYDAKTGEYLWEAEIDAEFQSSPTLVGDRIHLITQEGTMLIMAADREYRLLAQPELGEIVKTIPAYLDGRIYVRGEEHLYCIGDS